MVANLDSSAEPSMTGLYTPSKVFDIGGKRVGVIGYVTTEVSDMSDIGKLRITGEVEAVKKEAEKLHNRGVNIIMALGHAGFDKDMEVAKSVPHVDIVVGGHSNSFLYSGSDLARRKPENKKHRGTGYPTVATIGMNGLLVNPVIVEIYKYRQNRHNFKDRHRPQFYSYTYILWL